MKRTATRTYAWGCLWLVMYAVAVTLPMLLTLLGILPESRGFWIEFGVLLGFVAMSVMGLQFLLTGRFRKVGWPFGIDTILQFHRQIGIVALVLVLGHPVVLVLADPQYLSYFDPRVNFPRAVALVTALIATSLLIVLSLWRTRFRLSYEWWRLTHAGLAALVILIGLTHMLQVGHYVAGEWRQMLWVAFAIGTIFLLAYVRLVKPWKMRKRPWRVTEVRPERAESVTLVVEADGHPGMPFRGGQYAWITLGTTPWSLQQHPFSISSSASRADRIDYSIKPAGDFTTFVTGLRPGARAYLEGPYGRFCLDDEVEGGVFLMGGIGITPAMSILRTLRDQQDRRPHRLIYGNTNWEEVIFREELDELRRELNLEIVHVLDDPPAGWQGESGYIDADLLRRRVSDLRGRNVEYFVCGPEQMMDLVEQALLDLGIPNEKIRSERFQMV